MSCKQRKPNSVLAGCVAALLIHFLLVRCCLGQTLAPLAPLRSGHSQRDFHDARFDEPWRSEFNFLMADGMLENALLTADQFRQFAHGIHGRVIVDTMVRQTAWAEPVTRSQPTLDHAPTSPQRTTAEAPISASSSDGFAALNQPTITTFPPADLQTPATSQTPHVPKPANVPTEPDAVEPAPEAVTSSVGSVGTIGPALPEGSSFEVPISEQEIGQLSFQIQSQREIALHEPKEDHERLLQQLDAARKSLAQANKFMWKDIADINKAKKFDQEKSRLLKQLEQLRPMDSPVAGSAAADLFAQVEQLRTELEERNERLREINKAELNRKKRMEKIPEERTRSKSELAENQRQMKDHENGESDNYALIQLRAQELELEYRIKSLGSEAKLHELENRLLPMRGDFLAREIKLLETEIDLWNDAANEQRRIDIAAEVRAARLKAIEAAPALKTLANTAATLTQRRAEIAEKIRLASEEELAVQSEYNVVKNQHNQVEKSVVGKRVDEANGLLMVEIRRKLPRPSQSLSRISEIRAEQRKINLEQLELNEARKPLAHPFEYVEARLADIVSSTLPEEELRSMAVEFVENIRTQYDQLSSDHHNYAELLANIVAERKSLIGEIESTLAFVDEKSLWMQSAKSMGLEHLRKSQVGAQEFFSPVRWFDLLNCLTCRMQTSPHESAAGLFGLVTLFVFSRRFKG